MTAQLGEGVAGTSSAPSRRTMPIRPFQIGSKTIRKAAMFPAFAMHNC